LPPTEADGNDCPNVELSIVMPCLNEAETVAVCVRKARGWLDANAVAGEVVVADNGSTDGSQKLATEAGARVVPVAERGYGAALAEGFAAAKGRYVIMGDADDSYDFSNLMPFLAKLREGNQLVMGNRFAGGIAKGAMPRLNFYVGNPILSFAGRAFFRSPCRDFHCGLRGFDREAILGLRLQTTGMEFASEMVVKATLARLRIVEVPTTLRPDGRSRAPHLRPWRDGWRHLRFLLLYSPRWLFLLPGLGLMSVGAVIFAAVLPGPVSFFGATLDIHTLLAGAGFIVIGFQAIVFGMLTKVFAITEGLLPEDLQLNRLFRYITLETGLVAGSLLVLAGLVGCVEALWGWRGVGFGMLEASHTMRLFIPSVTACIVGSQTVMASFYLSILGLRRK
jgi:glycosyltransferase involved in cell wall biosynthesis